MTDSSPASSLAALRDRFRFGDTRMEVPKSVPKAFADSRGKSVPLRTKVRRSAIWLTPEEARLLDVIPSDVALLPPGDGTEEICTPDSGLAIANFHHEGQHWIAAMRPADIQNVIVQQQIFMESPVLKRPLAAHGQMRFVFRKGTGLSLFPQDEGQPLYNGPLIDDVIFSAEATGPQVEGFPDYDLIGGAKGWFRQSMRILSMEDKAAKVFQEGHTVNQYLLNLDQEERQKVLIAAVRRCHELGLDMPYSTLAVGGTQCVYEVFNILDRAVVKKRKSSGLGAHIFRMFDRMPLFVGRYLRRRGLRYATPEGKHLPTLNEEWDLTDAERKQLEMRLQGVA